MTFEAQAYRVDDDLFLAEAHQTVVHVDLEEREACPIPDPIRRGSAISKATTSSSEMLSPGERNAARKLVAAAAR